VKLGMTRATLRVARNAPPLNRQAPVMKRIALGITLAAVAAAIAGPPLPVTPDVRASLESWQNQAVSRDPTKLPAGIVTLCADSNGRFAAPGAKWEPTDYIQDPELPRARLIWFARSGDQVMVHFEKGGYAHSFHLLQANLSGGSQPVVVWRAFAPSELRDYSALLSALHKNQLLNDQS
jgi:hypothetical protein